MNIVSKILLNVGLRATMLLAAEVSAQAPSAVAVPDAAIVTTFHAEGAQIYECKSASDNKSPLTWQFREPIATLIVDGKSIGRHYAGPIWDHIDGSGVKAKAVATTPGATSNDIPWLKLEVVDRHNSGILSDVTTVQRVNTKGGVAPGSCKSAGSYLSVPYSADYVFLRRS